MTSPHLKKKKLAILKLREQEKQTVLADLPAVVVEPSTPVDELKVVEEVKITETPVVKKPKVPKVVLEQKQEEVKSEKQD